MQKVQFDDWLIVQFDDWLIDKYWVFEYTHVLLMKGLVTVI